MERPLSYDLDLARLQLFQAKDDQEVYLQLVGCDARLAFGVARRRMNSEELAGNVAITSTMELKNREGPNMNPHGGRHLLLFS